MTPTSLDMAERSHRLRATGDQPSGGVCARAVLPSSLLLLRFQHLRGHEVVVWPVCRGRRRRDRFDGGARGTGAGPIDLHGGGTPSLLPAELIGGLLTAVRTCFDVDAEAEVTLEANPIAGHTDYFAQLRSWGVNRISLGVQSSHADELQLLRRGHSFQDAIATYEAARRAGFDNMNLDLIYGLPAQPIEKWRTTLERMVALQPEHISAYSLQVEERTAMLRWVHWGVSQNLMMTMWRVCMSWHRRFWRRLALSTTKFQIGREPGCGTER